MIAPATLVLPRGRTRVCSVIVETLLPSIALVAFSIVKFPTRPAAIYGAAVLLGVGFLYLGVKFVLLRSRMAARRLLAASIVYLPLLFGLTETFGNASELYPAQPPTNECNNCQLALITHRWCTVTRELTAPN